MGFETCFSIIMRLQKSTLDSNPSGAIETEYHLCTFRSRLEARWGVFFDVLGIDWEYEPEGVTLSTGERYLPDFWLPTFDGGLYVEVKPTGGDFSKARRFVLDFKRRIWLAEGPPGLRSWWVLNYCNKHSKWTCGHEDGGPVVGETEGIPNADSAWGENRMFVSPGYTGKGGLVDVDCLSCLGQWYIEAVHQARSARFESPGEYFIKWPGPKNHNEEPRRPRPMLKGEDSIASLL